MWVGPDSLDLWRQIDEETRESTRQLTDDAGARNDAMWDWIAAHIPDEPLWFLDHCVPLVDERRADPFVDPHAVHALAR